MQMMGAGLGVVNPAEGNCVADVKWSVIRVTTIAAEWRRVIAAISSDQVAPMPSYTPFAPCISGGSGDSVQRHCSSEVFPRNSLAVMPCRWRILCRPWRETPACSAACVTLPPDIRSRFTRYSRSAATRSIGLFAVTVAAGHDSGLAPYSAPPVAISAGRSVASIQRPRARLNPRSTTFRSSRTLPGHACRRSNAHASGLKSSADC